MLFTNGSARTLTSEHLVHFLSSAPLVVGLVAPTLFDLTTCRYRSLKAERRKEIKAVEAALRLAQRKSRGATIPEDADAHGRAPPRLLILFGTQVPHK